MFKKSRSFTCFIILVGMCLNLFTTLSTGASIKILSVKNINITVNLNEKYTLPKTVTATMSNKTTKSVTVTWDKKTVDTSKVGSYTFKGTIAGYTPKVILVVKIVKPSMPEANKNENIPINKNQEDTSLGKTTDIIHDVWSKKKDLPFENKAKASTSYSPGLTMTQVNYDIKKAVAVNSKIYYIHNDGKVKVYDPVNDNWVDNGEIPQLKESNGEFSLVAVNDLIYIVGVNFRDVYEYNPVTNKCLLKTELPSDRKIGGITTVNGKIYIVGGLDVSEGSSTDAFDEYDPATDTWTSLAPLNQAANTVIATAVNNSICIIGLNIKQTDKGRSFNDSLEIYDFNKKSWSVKVIFDNDYRNENIEAINGKVYILRRGVDSKTKAAILHVEEYDPATNKFTPRADTSERNSFASIVLDGEIYIIGGMVNIEMPIPQSNNPDDIKKYFEERKRMDPSERVKFIKTVEKYTP